jgi:uncharacterized protein (DUF433 family)
MLKPNDFRPRYDREAKKFPSIVGPPLLRSLTPACRDLPEPILPVLARLEVERCLMERESVIVIDPEILGGTPCFRGTRVPVDSLIDYLEAGDTLDEFLDNFPSVTREAAIAALEEAKAHLTNSR